MTIIITSEKLVKEIQDEFTKLFPFLRIEFFIKTNYKSKERLDKISDMLSIGNAYRITESVEVKISPCTIVKDFESDFSSKFGMYAQLYRRSGNLWQEITITDVWTMKQQDQTGNEISSIIDRDIHLKSRRLAKTRSV